MKTIETVNVNERKRKQTKFESEKRKEAKYQNKVKNTELFRA